MKTYVVAQFSSNALLIFSSGASLSKVFQLYCRYKKQSNKCIRILIILSFSCKYIERKTVQSFLE